MASLGEPLEWDKGCGAEILIPATPWNHPWQRARGKGRAHAGHLSICHPPANLKLPASWS